MQEFQTNKANLTQARLQETRIHTLGDGEVRVKVDRFAFTANNITYAVMGDQLRYWQFFRQMATSLRNGVLFQSGDLAM
jgi:hypothetical protein